MLTKFYEITQSYFKLTVLNKINIVTATMNQYIIFLFLYNIFSIFEPTQSYYDDNGLTLEPADYKFFKQKYMNNNNDEQLASVLSYSMYAIGRLVFADIPQVKDKSDKDVKILFGFTPQVENVYNHYFNPNQVLPVEVFKIIDGFNPQVGNVNNYYFNPELTLFIDNFAKTSYNNRILLQNIYGCNSCFTNPNEITKGGPGPFPVDVNGTPQEYLDKVREPINYINLRVPTGVVKNKEGLPIIIPSNPSSYSDKTFLGYQIGWLDGFWYNSVTRNNLSSVEYSKLNTLDKIEVEVNKMLLEYQDLNDKKKIISEFFYHNYSDALYTSQALLLWTYIFNLKHNVSLRKEVVYLFANTVSILDVFITTWHFKRKFNSGRPVTIIRYYLSKYIINTWYPFEGTVRTTGNKFLPYQMLDFVTPAHPENLAAHPSNYRATAELFAKLYGQDFYDPNFVFEFDHPEWICPSLSGQTKFVFGQFIIPPKSSSIEPGLTPVKSIVLTWNNVFDWANQASISRLYGGIHWDSTNNASKLLGKEVAKNVYGKLVTSNIL